MKPSSFVSSPVIHLAAAVLMAAVQLLPAPGIAATLRVPFEYSSITAAANAAQSGDSIQVWPLESGEDWELQQIMLRQGVILRGMTPLNFGTQVTIQNSDVHLLDGPPNRGLDDTTRVENLVIASPMFHETTQVFSPRSSIRGCIIASAGPQDWYAIRMHQGGSIIGNVFTGFGESTGLVARQGTIIIGWNTFAMFRPFTLDTRSAPQPAQLSFRNNNVIQAADVVLFLRQDSNAEIVNCIFQDHHFLSCVGGSASLRHNDFWPTILIFQCASGDGNIAADPLFCSGPPGAMASWIAPNSPCVGAGEGGVNIGAGGTCGVTSVADHNQPPRPEVRLSIEPNPVRSAATFRVEGITGNQLLEIYSADGRLKDVLKLVAGKAQWNAGADLPRGMYFARVSGDRGAQPIKFVVIR